MKKLSFVFLILVSVLINSCKKDAENQNFSPNIKIKYPLNYSSISHASIIGIEVDATDVDGKISEVIFEIDSVVKTILYESPYKLDWDTKSDKLGKHYLKVKVKDNSGAISADYVYVNLTANYCVADFVSNKTRVAVGSEISFSDKSTNNPNSWLWNFGDGETSTVQNAKHTYTSAGKYSVSLIATNDYNKDTLVKNEYIEVGEAPIAKIRVNSWTTYLGGPLTEFTDASSNSPTSWLWDFGDGNTSVLKNPDHSYSNIGIYTISLIVKNDFGSDTLILSKSLFVTANPYQVADVDGNVYNIITINNKQWMKENLKVTHYNDNVAIDNLTSNTDWINATKGGWCYYVNNLTYGNTYGSLYNWYAVNSGKLCPSGWHVPSNTEWSSMFNYVGASEPGIYLKEAGTDHWKSPNTGSTNSSGFTALPGGLRRGNTGSFDATILYYGYFWSSFFDNNGEWYIMFDYSSTGAYSGYTSLKKDGYSVRCVKD